MAVRITILTAVHVLLLFNASSDANIYYLQRNRANETIVPFPKGLQMLAGNPNRSVNLPKPEQHCV